MEMSHVSREATIIASLTAQVRKLQSQLHNIESSRWWWLKTKVDRLKWHLRRVKKTEKRGWLGMMALPFTYYGRRLTRRVLKSIFRHLYLYFEDHLVTIIPTQLVEQGALTTGATDPYGLWRALNEPRPGDLDRMYRQSRALAYRPVISVLMPVYNPPLEFLDKAIQSVRDQVYPYWELCVADDASTDPGVRELLERHAAEDARVRIVYRDRNGHISAATNSALEIAQGEFVAFFDHDDMLAPDALAEYALALNADPTLDILYCDEDKIDIKGQRFEPYFKPQWCPDSLMSRNYITHFLVARADLVREVGGTRVGFEGSQDHDLTLRLGEKTDRVHRIPRILYHWRVHPDSTAGGIDAKPYALNAGVRSLESALVRRGEPGTVSQHPTCSGHYMVRYELRRPGKVSIIIPTRDKAEILETCLRSLFEVTQYPDFKVIVIDNQSEQPKTFELLDRYQKKWNERFQVLRSGIPFNFSRLVNMGAQVASGEYLLLLNNDTEAIDPDWLLGLLEQGQRPSIGCVGPMLLYPDRSVQHAGVVLQKDALASHPFSRTQADADSYANWMLAVNNYSAVTGACLLVRRDVFHQVGGFDEELAVDYNDVDFCLRVRDAGYRTVCLPYIRLLHHESYTRGHPCATPERAAVHRAEREYFSRRWSHVIDDDPCFNLNLKPVEHDIAINPFGAGVQPPRRQKSTESTTSIRQWRLRVVANETDETLPMEKLPNGSPRETTAARRPLQTGT